VDGYSDPREGAEMNKGHQLDALRQADEAYARMAKERDRLGAEVERLRAIADKGWAEVERLRRLYLIDDYAAEVERLRAALEEIARFERGSLFIGVYAVGLKDIARAALVRKERH